MQRGSKCELAIFRFDWPIPNCRKRTTRSHLNAVFFLGFKRIFFTLGGFDFLGRPKWKFSSVSTRKGTDICEFTQHGIIYKSICSMIYVYL